MFVCSVSTLLFNANPLLRYDGYYILSDMVGDPQPAAEVDDDLEPSGLAILPGHGAAG